MVAMGFGEPDFEPGMFPLPHQRQRVLVELLACRRQRGARFGSLQQGPPEQILERLHA
jgi:hypothetical protein